MTLYNLRQEDWRVQLPATILTIGLMWLLPFLVHLVGGPTAGSAWLPLFYAPVIAIVLFHPAVAVVAGLITPFLNHYLTGAPPAPMAIILTIELVVFAAVLELSGRRWPHFWAAAPLAYLFAKVATMILLAIVPVLPVPPGQFFMNSLLTAWPGLLVLLLLNWLVVRYAPRQ